MVSKKRVVQHASHGFDAFYNHYDKIFGSRWSDTLYPSLLKKNRVIAFVNPFFNKFPMNPQLFHPRAEWCTDTELNGCIHVTMPITVGKNEEIETKIGNLLHPSMLRQKRDVQAWLNEDDFKKADKMWYETIPDPKDCTYYEYFENLPEFSTKLKHMKLYKLSWRDIDPYYLIDAASVRIARMVDTWRGSVFMDMCSAPGGKSLILIDNMLKNHDSELQCKLISNEMGFKRTKILKQVIESFIPKDIQRQHLVLTNVDAKLIGLAEPNKYDSILLDAPCSGDRHLLKDEEEMKKWSIKSCKNIGKTQFGLLRSALQCVRIGSTVVYATCSLSDIENDQLIHQLVKKQKGKVQILDISLNIGEKTEYGWQILPDISPFAEGPLYVAKLRRIN